MDVVRNQPGGSGALAPTESTRNPTAQRPERVRAVAPPVDVLEGEDAILVLADLPGVGPEDLTIRLEKNELSVSARRKDLAEAIEYRRAFAIPPDVDGDAIAADLSRGVLKLTLPRKASSKPRQIPVRGG